MLIHTGLFITELEFQTSALQFLEELFKDLDHKKVIIPAHWDIDHLCYRVESLDLYKKMKTTFLNFSTLLIESDVNGRPIATFKLNKFVNFRGWKINVVELPAPKASKPTPTGFEHIEVVCDVPFHQLEAQYKHLKLDLSGLAKDFNQEFEISLGSRNLKFHHLSLESVVRLESNRKVWSTLQKSNILKDFKQHNPLIAGTFPLGLEGATSDLDIIMHSSNLDELQLALTKTWHQAVQFKIERVSVRGVDSLIINFSIDEIPFEIFAQNKESVRQDAYLHFVIEERLLKLGGEKFFLQILKLRESSSLKTEPAFTQALNLTENPYDTLLALQRASSDELLEMLLSL